MRIGFVFARCKFGLGMGIRTAAVRKFLAENSFLIKDIELKLQTPGASANFFNPLSYWLSPEMLKSLFKKVFLGQDFSVSTKIKQKEEVEQAQKMLEYQYQSILEICNNVDILHAETHIPAFICSKIKEKTGIPYIFDMHGLRVEEMKRRGEPEALINLWDSIEKRTIKNADCVIVVSHLMKEYVNKYFGKPLDQIVVIPNGSELYEKKANYKTPMKIIYGGGFDAYERVLDFVKIEETLKNGEYQFFLMGDGLLSSRNEILNYINTKYLNVIYLGKKSRDQSLEIFSDMQVGVAPSTKDIVRETASPIKVLDYAACGLPIVTVNAGEWSDTIKKYDCGIVVENSDSKEFAEALKQLKDRSIWEKKSANGERMIAEKYNWSLILKPLKELYYV